MSDLAFTLRQAHAQANRDHTAACKRGDLKEAYRLALVMFCLSDQLKVCK